MKRKCLAVGIILLFIGTTIIPKVISEQTQRKNIITVNDNGGGDYTSIKEAVNQSNPGDTIEVYSGTYYEDWISLDKENISLLGVSHDLGGGNDTGKPFIKGNGTGTVIQIEVNHVTVSNFRVENPWSGSLFVYCIHVGIEVVTKQNNDTISNCTLSNSTHSGIYCAGVGKDMKIIDNEISRCNDSGIIASETESFVLKSNTIMDVDGPGIMFDGVFHNVSGNVIKKCVIGIQIGGNYNRIEGNDIDNCSVGVNDIGDGGNIITENNFRNYNQNEYWWERHVGAYILWGVKKDSWISNYWDSWSGVGPKIILGHLIFWIPLFVEVLEVPIPWINFDWHPAQEPYNILGVR